MSHLRFWCYILYLWWVYKHANTCSSTYIILIHNTNLYFAFLLLLLCAWTPFSILIHHPQCFIGLINSTLPSVPGTSVGWLLCKAVSTFVHVILCITNHHCYSLMLCTVFLMTTRMYWHCYIIMYIVWSIVVFWSSPPPSPPPLCVDSILHPHPSSTVFYRAYQFNAPLGSWDVSRVTTMQSSEYIRACDIVHHQPPLL